MIGRYGLVIAISLGCSRTAAIGPAPEPPKPPPPSMAGVYKLGVSTTHEISCSQSFQTDSEYVSYELSIGADATASLAVKAHTSSLFGPSSSKFTGGPATKNESKHEAKYTCRASVEGDATQFDCAAENGKGSAKLTCRATNVEISDGGAKVRVDALGCKGLPSLPEDVRNELKGSAPLAIAPGLWFSIHDFGHGSPMITLHRGF